jgi:DNA-binding transcriptional MerR regulator
MRNDEDKRWKVGELAGVTGLTVRALHHYDDVGLLVPSQRTSGGHRVYDARDVERLYRILALRRLGLRLDEIASLLDDGGVSLLETVRRHLEQVERELAHQHRLRERLRRIRAVAAEAGPDREPAAGGRRSRGARRDRACARTRTSRR